MPLQLKGRLVCDECSEAEELWLQQGAVLNHLELPDDYEGGWVVGYQDANWHQLGSSSASATFRITSPTEVPERSVTCSDDCRAVQDARHRLAAEEYAMQMGPRVLIHKDNFPGGVVPTLHPTLIGTSDKLEIHPPSVGGSQVAAPGQVITTTGTHYGIGEDD